MLLATALSIFENAATNISSVFPGFQKINSLQLFAAILQWSLLAITGILNGVFNSILETALGIIMPRTLAGNLQEFYENQHLSLLYCVDFTGGLITCSKL